MIKRYVLGTIACLVVLLIVAQNSSTISALFNKPLVYSEKTMLEALWHSYKKSYWESTSGRTIDLQSNSITTSEGQSYTMLRAVWLGDKSTFDTTWQWTTQYLQQPQSSLFAWKWGMRPDKTYGVIENGGQNAASDADTDIALALLMAASRWQNTTYLTAAERIIHEIWESYVVQVEKEYYLLANNVEKNYPLQPALINPSYLAPYAYKIFARIDEKHDWNGLVDSSYSLINTVIDSSLNTLQSAGIPPDWVVLNQQTGALSASENPSLTTNFGYDAIRLPFRLALDWSWFGEERAKSTLGKMRFLSDEWNKNADIAAVYNHAGKVQSGEEHAAVYGGTLGYFQVADPEQAKAIYTKKLLEKFDATENRWIKDPGYYGDN